MSARDLKLPDRAAVELMAGLGARVTAVERASMWSGVVRSDIDATGGTSPWQYTGAVGYPYAGATVVASLTLDPGRWVLLSMLETSLFVGSDEGGPSSGQVGSILRIASPSVSDERFMSADQRGGGIPAKSWTFNSALQISPPDQSTATLSFFYGLTPNAVDPYGNGAWARATLLAFPG